MIKVRNSTRAYHAIDRKIDHFIKHPHFYAHAIIFIVKHYNIVTYTKFSIKPQMRHIFD